jgi:hypothetical protein
MEFLIRFFHASHTRARSLLRRSWRGSSAHSGEQRQHPARQPERSFFCWDAAPDSVAKALIQGQGSNRGRPANAGVDGSRLAACLRAVEQVYTAWISFWPGTVGLEHDGGPEWPVLRRPPSCFAPRCFCLEISRKACSEADTWGALLSVRSQWLLTPLHHLCRTVLAAADGARDPHPA